MKEIKNLVYVAIQIKSHEVETGFYKNLLWEALDLEEALDGEKDLGEEDPEGIAFAQSVATE